MGNTDVHETQALCKRCKRNLLAWIKNLLIPDKKHRKMFICHLCDMRLDYLAYEREKSLAFQTTRLYHGKS